MKRQAFLVTCAVIAAASITLAAVLWLTLGARWFSLYGWAIVGLSTVLPLSVILWTRARTCRQSRWPIALFALPAISICVIQIGYWLAFFSAGTQGIPLGIGRAIARPYIDPILIASTFILGAYGIWLVLRSAKLFTSHSRRR